MTDAFKYDSMGFIQVIWRSVNDTVYYVQRGCTGFDGLTEDGEAVRGRTPRKKFDLNLNAEDNFALAA